MSDKPIPEAQASDQGADQSQKTAAQTAGRPGADTTATASPGAVTGDPVTSGETAASDGETAPPGPASKGAANVAPAAGAASDSPVGGGASTAVLTKTSEPGKGPESPPAAPNSDGSVPFATLLAASRESSTVRPGTAGWQAAAWPSAPSAGSPLSGRSMPLPVMPPPLPPVPKRWQHVARPPGVLPAAALAGIVGATVIPIDRPGIGWLLAGTAITAALCVVDYRARSLSTREQGSPESAPTTGTAPATTPPTTAPTSSDAKSAEPLSRSVPDSLAAPNADDAVTGSSEAGRTADTESTGENAPANAATAAEADSADAGSGAARQPLGAEAAEDSVSGERSPDHSGASGGIALRFGESASTREVPTDRASHPGSIGDRIWWAAAAILLLGVGTVRAAGWLFVLCVIAACVAGSLAVLGRRSVRGIVHDMFAVPFASFGAVPWAFSGLRESRSVGTSSVRRYGVSVAATAALLVVFVPLLGGADATFAGLLNGLVPTVDGPAAWQWTFLFVIVTAGVLGALYLLAGPPSRAADSVRPARLWSRSEWMLPVVALTVLFAVFVGAQFVALFGGDDYVQRTAGLTYAEYARSGFWQLSAVSILTLAVILAVLHWSVQETAADRRSLRILLSAVSVLALVIVGSALGRMWTYQQAYGFTVLRLLVTMCELWVGLVYVLVLIAVARLRWTWVPRAAIGTALATLIALAVINPEHLVAERNIDRWHASKRLDADYLSGLSPDILPALDGLGDSYLRAEIEDAVRADLDEDHWWSWNWSRSSAR